MRLSLIVAILASWVSLVANAAGDPAIGKTLATPCTVCHGEIGGNPALASNPIIYGQYEDYLLRSMLAYQKGSRINPIMIQQMAPLNKQDLENLAAYFAAQSSSLN